MKNVLGYIDSHCHIPGVLSHEKLKLKYSDYLNFEKDMQNIASKYDCKIDACINVSCDVGNSIDEYLEYLKFPLIYGTFGIHPHEAKFYDENLEKKLIEAMKHEKSLAWGETGLDYYYKFSDIDIQKKVFKRQLEMAVNLNKPVVIHSRDAYEDTLNIMNNTLPDDFNIHFHCFTYEGNKGIEIADTLMKKFKNLYFGFTGAITFKKAGELRKVVETIPIERLLLETDSPYMAPGEYRGKVCHSGMIPVTAIYMADIKKLSIENVIEETKKNTIKLYNIKNL